MKKIILLTTLVLLTACSSTPEKEPKEPWDYNPQLGDPSGNNQ